MENKKYVGLFKKDCKFYDKDNKELKAILSLIKQDKNKTLIDIGAGIGRLSIPLSKYFKVTAIDNNKYLLNTIKNKDIIKINKKIENYYPKEKFDYALIAWFDSNERRLRHIKKYVVKEKGKIVLVKPIENEYRNLAKKLFKGRYKAQPRILQLFSRHFNLQRQQLVETAYVFSDFKTALNITIFEFFAFWNKKVNKKHLRTIKSFLGARTRKGKVYIKTKLKVILYTNS